MKSASSIILKFAVSFLLGLCFALAFAFPYFNNEAYALLDKFALVAVPAFSFTFVLYYLLPYIEDGLKQIGFQEMINVKERYRLLLGWLFGGIPAFFATAFLGNFYPQPLQVFCLGAFSFLAFGVLCHHGFCRLKRFMKAAPADFGIASFLFALVIALQVMFFRAGLQFPNLFNADFFLLKGQKVALFILAGIVSLPCLAWILRRLKQPALYRVLSQNGVFVFVRENLSGLTLSALFFSLYLLIGSVLNHPRFDTDDIFFDSDGFIWRYRLTTEHWQDFYWRSVHPLALLILRSLVNFLSIFLNGDLPFAAIVLTAFAGATCVFLAWIFMKGVMENETSALIMASLLGLSASHLFFGSLIETYIFLAAVTLLCFVLMQKKIQSLPLLVSVGVITMGITLTNFAQTAIALFGAKPNLKFMFRYVLIVLALVVSLTLMSSAFYPNASPYFFVPSSFLAERQNVRAISKNRIQALTRAFLFNNIAAPSPMMSHKDIPFTQFRFYRAEDYKISEYSTPLQAATARIWLAFLALAAIFFIKDFKSHPMSLTLSLIGCVLLSLLIHLRYGKELFLYSTNWTYAVVFLLGISWKSLLKYRWFQIMLVAFLLLLLLNNAALFRTIMEVSAPYIQ
jgi:hypothetical protein